MGIVVLSPFGLLREESGMLSLFSNYLKKSGWNLSSLSCNGVFSLCDRDGENNWSREVKSCFECMHQQAALAKWAGVGSESISPYLLPDDVLESKRWMLRAEAEGLYSATFRGVNIYDLCRGSLRFRFGSERPDLKNKNHDQIVRRMMLCVVRMLLASENFNRKSAPDLVLIGGGEDYITATYALCAARQRIKAAIFKWDSAARCVRIKHPLADKEYVCPLVFEDITAMRADCRTWPWEILRILDEIVAFLDLNSNQLELPIAR